MNSIRTLAVSTGILTIMGLGCVKQQQSSAPPPSPNQQSASRLDKPPEIVSESVPDDFFDLVFYIQDHNKLSDGTQIIRATGTYNDKSVAFELALGPTWKPGSFGDGLELVTYVGTITYRSLGAESDNFVQALDALYEVNLNPKSMRKETIFAGISLGGDPRDLTKGEVQLKLFYESDDEEKYAELYTNIDLVSRKLYLNEKDPDYRVQVVRALRAD